MSELASLIRAQIAADGPITFARFMELALYHPRFGYYEKDFSQTGKHGDFFTNVSVGPLFGQFLGFDFTTHAAELPNSDFYLVESGAHDGRLAADILEYIQQFQPEFFERLTYLIVEPSSRRAYHQQEALEPFGKRVRWVKKFQELTHPLRGIVFSNELLDAFPVHVFRWDAAALRWREHGVTTRGDDFAWVPLPVSDKAAQALLPEVGPELGSVLPNGFQVEVCPGALEWWRQAASSLEAGWLLAFDYGSLAERFLQPDRAKGSLRAYSEHHLASDVLHEPGQQDITANVNFSQIMAAGEQQGFVTVSLSQQGQYLKHLLEQIDSRPSEFPLWTASRFRQLTSLIHPEHLGRSFKTLIQKK